MCTATPACAAGSPLPARVINSSRKSAGSLGIGNGFQRSRLGGRWGAFCPTGRAPGTASVPWTLPKPLWYSRTGLVVFCGALRAGAVTIMGPLLRHKTNMFMGLPWLSTAVNLLSAGIFNGMVGLLDGGAGSIYGRQVGVRQRQLPERGEMSWR